MDNLPMDIKELAAYLHMSPGYVREMAAAGRIPIRCIIKPPGARRYLFDRELIKEWSRATPVATRSGVSPTVSDETK